MAAYSGTHQGGGGVEYAVCPIDGFASYGHMSLGKLHQAGDLRSWKNKLVWGIDRLCMRD